MIIMANSKAYILGHQYNDSIKLRNFTINKHSKWQKKFYMDYSSDYQSFPQ